MRSKGFPFRIGVLLAIALFWVLAFYLPMTAKIAARQRESADVAARIMRVEGRIKYLEELREKATEGNGRAHLPDRSPQPDIGPDFMGGVALYMKKGGVAIERMNGRIDDDGRARLMHMVTETDMTGRFLDIGRVLERIRDMGAFRRVVNARLVARDDTYPDIRGSLEIEFVPYPPVSAAGAFKTFSRPGSPARASTVGSGWGVDPFLLPEGWVPMSDRAANGSLLVAIMEGREGRMAIFDHTILKKGDMVGKERILDIADRQVTLVHEGMKRIVAMGESR